MCLTAAVAAPARAIISFLRGVAVAARAIKFFLRAVAAPARAKMFRGVILRV